MLKFLSLLGSVIHVCPGAGTGTEEQWQKRRGGAGSPCSLAIEMNRLYPPQQQEKMYIYANLSDLVSLRAGEFLPAPLTSRKT